MICKRKIRIFNQCQKTKTVVIVILFFTISVVPEPRPSISWYKEDEELTDSDRYQLSSDGNGTFVLNIVPLEVDDQAEWKCVAVNKYGQTVTSSFLKLNVPKNFKPPRFLDELRIAFSNEGSVNLECKVRHSGDNVTGLTVNNFVNALAFYSYCR